MVFITIICLFHDEMHCGLFFTLTQIYVFVNSCKIIRKFFCTPFICYLIINFKQLNKIDIYQLII